MEEGKTVSGEKVLQLFSELTGRLNLASKLGVDSYSGARDVYEALGYPKQLSFADYWSRYKRHDIAKAIIDRPVKASWKGEIQVIENLEDKSTEFEKAWTEVSERLKLKSIFIRADKLTGIGRYSILFLGLDDAKTRESLAKPVTKGKRKLLYVKPLAEKDAQISLYETDPLNERYGLPKAYTVNVKEGDSSITVIIHHTRVVHLVEDLLDNEIFGTPRLEVVYNRLMDLEKLVGGDAEMFWRGARPGYTGTVDKDYTMTDEMYLDLKSQIDEYENNLRRILVNEGINYKALEQQIADPINHVDVQMQMISAVTGIPKRILTGSERGELSSAQDKLEWIAYVTSRREEQNEPMILRPFIDKMIEIGVLPKPKTPYKIMWDKLFSLSDKEKVEIGEIRSKSLKNYLDTIATEAVPLRLFLEYFLAFDTVQVEEVMGKISEDKLTQLAKEEQLDDSEVDLLSKESPEYFQNT